MSCSDVGVVGQVEVPVSSEDDLQARPVDLQFFFPLSLFFFLALPSALSLVCGDCWLMAAGLSAYKWGTHRTHTSYTACMCVLGSKGRNAVKSRKSNNEFHYVPGG